MEKPKAQGFIITSGIIETCKEFIDDLEEGIVKEDHIADYENKICETAMKAVYGDNIYEWINEKIMKL